MKNNIYNENQIRINKHSNGKGYAHINSNSKWFDGCEYCSIEDNGIGELIIKKCYSTQVTKKSHKINRIANTINMSFKTDIPLGIYEINKEESNEDELIINYKTK